MSQSSTEFHSDRSPVQEGQLAPHNVEAEEAVLGSILLNPDARLEVESFLKPDDFFLVRHGWIYQAMLDLAERKDPVDHLTVINELEQSARLGEVGGAAYIISLINKTPSALNIEGYGRIVERMALRRRLIEAAQQVARVAHSDETEIDEVVDKAQRAIFSVTERKVRGRRVRFGDVPDTQLDQSKTLFTGIPELDDITDGKIGFGRSLAIVGASGHYKTTLACQVVSNLAIMGHPVLYVSQEMNEHDIRDRMVSYQAWLTGKSVQHTRQSMRDIPLEFLSGQQWLGDIAAHVRAMSMTYDRPGVLVIDTVQKLRDSNKGGSQEMSSMASASAAIDGLKLASGWLVISLLQQYLETNDADPKHLRPSRNNVKGTKAFYEDADAMIGTYWADGWRNEFPGVFEDILCPRGNVMIKCIKNRYGKVGLSKLLWLMEAVPALASPRPEYGTSFAEESHPENENRSSQMEMEMNK